MNTSDELKAAYDVVVIGGGAAGLSGALMLGRSLRSVAVIDAGQPRNAPAHAIHGLLGHEGTSPSEFLEKGRSEVRSYGVDVVSGEVIGATGSQADGFEVRLADGRRTTARRLLVTTGLVDTLPDVPGVAERWGKDVLHCPYCHGHEVRDQVIGVLATGPMATHQAQMFRQLSADVTLYSHAAGPDAEQRVGLVARGIPVVEAQVVGIEVTDGHMSGLHLSDGRTAPCQALIVTTHMVARAGFLSELGLETELHPSGFGDYLPADPVGKTRVPGVSAAGNITEPMAQVGASAAAGAMAGAMLNGDLIIEEVAAAIG